MLVFSLFAAIIVSVIQYNNLNQDVEVRNVYKYELGEKIKGGDISVVVEEMKILDRIESEKVIPKTIENNKQELLENEFVTATVEMNIHNTRNEDVEMSVTDFMLQSKEWSNAFDLEAYQELNNISGVIIKLEGNEKKKIILPYFIYDYQWPEKYWKDIKRQKYNLIIMVYPEKHYVKMN